MSFLQNGLRAFLPEFFFLVLIGFLLGWNNYLFPIDTFSELFHIEAAKESLTAGHFWVPILHGHDYLIRGPLWTWIVMIFFKLMGIHLGTARLAALIGALLGLTLTNRVALELTRNRMSAFFAMAVMAGGWGFIHGGVLSTSDILTMDLYLAFLWAFLKWQAFASRRIVMRLETDVLSALMGILLGCLLLTKDSLAVVLLLMIALGHLIITQRLKVLSRLNVFLCMVSMFSFPVLWLLIASIQSQSLWLIPDFLIRQPWERWAGLGPWRGLHNDMFFFVKRFLLNCLPYGIFIPALLWDAGLLGNHAADSMRSENRLLLNDGQEEPGWLQWLAFWFFIGFFIYSFSVFQEPTALLPFYPALAIGVGHYLARVMEEGNNSENSAYEIGLIACVMLMMFGGVLATILTFQVLPSQYVSGFWHFPGPSTIEVLKFGKHMIDLPEAFPLWKLWLTPGLLVLLVGAGFLYLLKIVNRLSATPLAMVSIFLILCVLGKGLYLPMLSRPVAAIFARHFNQDVRPPDRLVIDARQPELKRMLFYLTPATLACTQLAQDPELFRQQLLKASNHHSGIIYGILPERDFFQLLDFNERSQYQVTQANWVWNTDEASELGRLWMVRLPRFDKLKSEFLSFQTFPANIKAEAWDSDENPSLTQELKTEEASPKTRKHRKKKKHSHSER